MVMLMYPWLYSLKRQGLYCYIYDKAKVTAIKSFIVQAPEDAFTLERFLQKHL
jgi:hypothetical protein